MAAESGPDPIPRLIELVRQNPVLYDNSHRTYSNIHLKHDVWTTIAQELNADVEYCKKKWNCVRDNYRKSLRKNAARKEAKLSPKYYKYAELMEFWDPFFHEAETFRAPSEKCIAASESSDDDLDDGKGMQVTFEGEKMQSDATDTVPVGDSESLAVLSRYVKEREVERSRKRKKSALCAQGHPVDVFLASLAPALKALTPYQLSLAKAQLFAVVHKFDLRRLGPAPPTPACKCQAVGKRARGRPRK